MKVGLGLDGVRGFGGGYDWTNWDWVGQMEAGQRNEGPAIFNIANVCTEFGVL